jgi:hypothetical protein
MEHNPPAIFLVYALGAQLGDHQVGVRILEMLAVITMGHLVGAVTATVDRRVSPGAAALLASGFYYTTFDYWRTAQAEIWVALCVTAAWCVLRGRSRWLTRSCGAGALAGLAVMFKFTAVIPGLVLAGFGAWRAAHESDAAGRRWRRAVSATASFGGAAFAVACALIVPFVITGTTTAMWQALVPFNLYYARGIEFYEVGYLRFFGDMAATYSLAAALALGAVVWCARGGADGRRPIVGFLLEWALLSAVLALSVTIQGKYLAYHWGVMTPVLVAILALGSAQIVAWSPAASKAAVVALVLFAFVLANPTKFWRQDFRQLPYRSHVRAVIALAAGDESRWEFLDRYDYLHEYRDAEAAGRQANIMAGPGDTLCVLGQFAPAVYTAARLRCPSRFFSDHVLVYLTWQPQLAGAFHAWTDEHWATLLRSPPTFLVVRHALLLRPPPQLLSQYRKVAQFGGQTLLRRLNR